MSQAASPHSEEEPVDYEHAADQQEVAEFASTLSTNYLLCRELQHNWKPFTAHWDDEHHHYARVIRCVRCRTRKVQRLSSTGHILASHYEYPEGYLHEKFGRIIGESRDVLRLESLLRSLDGPPLKSVQ
jgi:hypothetical protein